MEGNISRTKPAILITGLVMVALSIAIFINPIGAMTTLVRIIGWVFVAYGAVMLVSAIFKGDPIHNAPSVVVLGVVAVIAGLFMALMPEVLVSFVWTILGIVILITGVLDIFEARDFRATSSPLAGPATVSGILTVVLGLVVVFAPMFSAVLGMLAAAIALFVGGITEIIFGLGR